MPNHPANLFTAPRGGWRGNLIVLSFMALVLGLIVRSLVTEDSRFGWGMFGQNCEYIIYYDWIDAEGGLTHYQPGTYREISPRGESNKVRNHRQNHSRNTRYGMGTLRRWIQGYEKYLYENHRPPNAIAIQATLIYVINRVHPHGQNNPNKWTAPPNMRRGVRTYPRDLSSWQQEKMFYPPAQVSEFEKPS